ncbi:stress response protein NST1 isoform X2 [Trifolium pratense]|uniref:stress response protein NST1 isoform X2 n=1 Tax=Trifolium pratense TaxID=57577 RepID=UPI001E696D2B|nr:stress response protein NST1 isoform X2 [Trifolium pratense]
MTKKDNKRNDKHDEKKELMIAKKNKKRNVSRLGGSGRSLNVSANAKSNNNQYNPALIKKQRELYKNAKNVNKYKKMLKRQNLQNEEELMLQPKPQNVDLSENLNETEGDKDKNERRKPRKKDSAFSLEELYKKKHEEKEKERMEREAIFKEKKEQREKAEARRKTLREQMFKKTRKGQPVMKYRIEHLLETIQGSVGNKS